jgi:hypothetical protein
MKQLKDTVVKFVVATLLISMNSFADNHAAPQINALDFYSCSFNKGKDMDDLRKLDGDYNDWAAKHLSGPFYSYIMTPEIANSGDWNLDLLWLDIFSNHESLGRSNKAWDEKASEIDKKFNKIWTCDSHSTATSVPVKPLEEAGGSGMLTVWACTFKEGKSFVDLASADMQWVAHMDQVGMEGGLYRWIPDAGWARDDNTDYLIVYASEDLVMRGRTIDLLWAGSGQVLNSIYDGIQQCDNPRIWDASAVGGRS